MPYLAATAASRAGSAGAAPSGGSALATYVAGLATRRDASRGERLMLPLLALLAHAYLAVTAVIAPKDLAAASSRSPSARSAVS
jgi:hypothetical protein